MAAAVFLLLVLLTDYRVMLGWFLSIADAFNYIFPLLMIGVLLLELPPERRGGTAISAMCAFLAGATTEQGGAMAIGLIFLTLLWQKCHRAKIRPYLWALAAALLGYATIFASPATRQRAAAELSLSGLIQSFVQFANSLAAPGLSLRIMVIFSLIAGLMPLTKKAPKLLYAGLPLGVLLSAGFFLPLRVGWNSAMCFLFFCYLLSAAVALVFRSDYWRSGFLLLAGLASAGLVMLSQSCSVRVTVPLVQILILCAVFFLTELYLYFDLGSGRRHFLLAAGLSAIFALTIFLQLPAFRGVRGNYVVLRNNELAVAEARDTHVFAYQDYDPEYASSLLFSSDPLSTFYLQYYQLPPDTEIVRAFSTGPTVVLGGQEESVLYYEGRAFLPLRPLVEGRGGSIWMVTDSFLEMQVDEKTILYHWPLLYTDTGTVNAAHDMLSYNSRFYISQELAQKLSLFP